MGFRLVLHRKVTCTVTVEASAMETVYLPRGKQTQNIPISFF